MSVFVQKISTSPITLTTGSALAAAFYYSHASRNQRHVTQQLSFWSAARLADITHNPFGTHPQCLSVCILDRLC